MKEVLDRTPALHELNLTCPSKMYVEVISELISHPVPKHQISPPSVSGLLPDWRLAPPVNVTACPPDLAPEHGGCLPTHVNVTVLMKEEPCHLLTVKLDVVLHVLHGGLLLPGRRVS